MNRPIATITAIDYELGECVHRYDELPNFYQQATVFGMPDDAAMWGWGEYRRSARKAEELALASTRKTLAASHLTANDIDAIVLCAVSFPASIELHMAYTHCVLGELQLLTKPLFALTLNRCTTLLTGVQLARSLVLSGEYNNVLVISADTIESEEDRFKPFAIFSDAAASCIVTSQCKTGYQIQTSKSIGSAITNPDLPDIGAKLALDMAKLLDIQGGLQAVARVFHDNLFIPIVTMREQMAGCPSDRLYLENIARVAHCCSSDPFINLVDCELSTPIAGGDSLLLACSTPGIRSAVLLNKVDHHE